MKLATIAAISIFAGCLGAQTNDGTQTETRTTMTTVNWNGTLIDQACYTTQTHRKETTSNGGGSTTTTETTRVVSDCPATTTSTNFGLLTPEGKFIRFDDAGNTRVIEMMKTNKDWRNYMDTHKPVTVRVVGTPNGDVVVVKEIR
jgi:hypothetical protein